MKKSTRVGILGIVLVLVLAAGMFYLELTIGQSSTETAKRIGEVFGAAIGAIGVFFFVWWLPCASAENRRPRTSTMHQELRRMVFSPASD